MNSVIFELKSLNLLKPYNRRLWARRLRLPISLRGVKLEVHKIKSNNIVTSILRGTYEAAEASSLKGWLKADSRILELGTGFGFVTTLAAKQASLGKILSYEADPRMVKLAQCTLELNKVTNAELRQGIVAVQEGAKPFFLSPDFWESSLTPNSIWKEISVPAFSLESVLSSYQPTAVIIDIEGGEYELLENTAWNRALSIQKMSIEFHKCSNPIQVLRNLSVFGSDWECNTSIDQLANHLEHGHMTVTFRRNAQQP